MKPAAVVRIFIILCLVLACAPPPPKNELAATLITQFMENYVGLNNASGFSNPSDPDREAAKTVIVDKLTIGPYDKVGDYFPVSADIYVGCKKKRDLKKTSEMTISFGKYNIPGNWKFKLKPMKNEEWTVDTLE